ncbi:MAG: glycoside hydrolase family 15 protein [Planctomycetaceae bacterium]
MINPSNAADDLPEETPEALRGIAERLQHAIDELLAVRAEAEESSHSVTLTEAADRVLSESARPESDQTENSDPARANFDRRLYLPAADGWHMRIKSGPREYCYFQSPGEDWFHGLVDGELFLQNGDEKLCLNCALRRGILTDNRLFWQTGRHHARLSNTLLTESFSQTSNPHDRKADMNQSIEGLLRDQYRVDDVRAITQFLIEHGTFEFPTLKSGLFSAAVAHTQDQQYTGYQNVWVRDNIHIAYHFHVLGEHDKAVRAVASIMQFEHTQRDKLRNIIVGKVNPQNVMLRPHIRFDGDHLVEVSEQWAHAQNDALGYWLWLASKLALAGHWQPTGEDIKLMSNFVQYFEAIQFWQDEDNGHWEEARKVEASSLGAVVAGLTALRDYFVTMASVQMPQGATNSFIDQTCRRAESLIERGQAALKAILPNECIQDDPAKQRQYDAALLFLIYPLQIVEGEMAEKIISNVVTHLLGEHGIRRYLGDSYWCADYKKLLDPNSRTVDVSDDMSARDSLLQPGGEAQWCLFDPILSVIHGQRFQQTGDAGQLELQTRHLNRSLRQLSGEGGSYPPLRCPESNYRENGVWGPNDITPLLWTQANLRLALHFMEQSLTVGDSSRTA